MVSIIILYYNFMEPPSYMWSVTDRNVVMQCVTVNGILFVHILMCLAMTLQSYSWILVF